MNKKKFHLLSVRLRVLIPLLGGLALTTLTMWLLSPTTPVQAENVSLNRTDQISNAWNWVSVPDAVPLVSATALDLSTPLVIMAGIPSFADYVYFGMGVDNISNVVVGDMDGDGDLDIVKENRNEQSVIYLNDGGGNFTDSVDFGSGSDINVVVGDMDGDGDLDIVTGSLVYLNDGGGKFTDSVDFETGSDNTVVVGDMNGDGHLDIVAGNYYTNVVYLNDGLGSFTDSVGFGTENDNFNSLAVGDMDRDGDLDIITENVIYHNNGGGDFSPGVNYGPVGSIVLGDIEGDGDLDIVTESVVYLNDGMGIFTDTVDFGTGWDRNVVVGDMDGDDDLDIIAGNAAINDDEPNVVYLNEGGGNFTNSVEFGPKYDSTQSVAIGDMDGDGHLDIVTANVGQNIVYLNDGGGEKFTSSVNYGTGNESARSVLVGDMDGDGHLDIVAGNSLTNVVYLNDGVGSFPITTTFGTGNTNSIAVGDMDGDGDLDIVVGNYTSPSVVYLNDGVGNFTNSVGFGYELELIYSIALGDMDGDGDLDIVTGSDGRQNKVYLNDEVGNFTNSVNYSTRNDSTYSIAIGDVDGDGDLDIINGNNYDQNVVYLNDGGANFTDSVNYGTGLDETISVAVGDMDGDGDLDIVAGNAQEKNIVYLNDGGGRFISGANFGIGHDWNSSLAVGDLDGDGDLDIVVGNEQEPPKNEFYLNDGRGGFPIFVEFGIQYAWTSSVAVGDLDGDGDLDIIVGNIGGGDRQSAVYLNNLRGPNGLANNPHRISVTRPGTVPEANFFHTPQILDDSTIPITFTLFDPEGDPVGSISGEYSQNGGGDWKTAVPASTIGPVIFGTALKFDGEDDYVIASTFDNAPSTDVTISFWMNSTDTSSTGTPLSYATSHSDNEMTIHQYNNFRIYLGGNWVDTGISATDGRWHHIAITWRSSDGQLVAYKDGDAVFQEILISAPLVDGGSLVLGQEQDSVGGGFDPFQAFEGRMDEIRIWNIVRQPIQIRRDMYRQLTGNEPGLVGYWNLDDGAGATAFDQTTNGNDGLLGGNVVAQQPIWVGDPFATNVFNWDLLASGFFGQSDNVVLRFEAVQPSSTGTPETFKYFNSTPGPIQWPYASATTFPFRVRGTQVRVVDEATNPVEGAIVYRLLSNQTENAQPYTNRTGQLSLTDKNGYLQGYGELYQGDQIAALLPITSTDNYTVYHTSASPTADSLDMLEVSEFGMQTITVSVDNHLVLFNLDISLEWDTRYSKGYLYRDQLEFDLQRASELLFDWSNGQAALGRIRVFQNREHWNDAHIRIYATNRLRPNANQGGVVSAIITETIGTDTIAYEPGQVRMGAVWNRFGDFTSNLGEDWPRTLAHELGHYLFFLDDNYLGLTENGILFQIDTCPGAMTDPYSDDDTLGFDEFHPEKDWLPECKDTLSQQATGRSDWETIQTFYPWLDAASENPGPNVLPLAVTQIEIIAPDAQEIALDVPIFYLKKLEDSSSYLPTERARVFLLQGDRLVDLGSPVNDLVNARGARAGETLCAFDLPAHRFGCEEITSWGEQLHLADLPGWEPQVIVTPVTSRTFQIEVDHIAEQSILYARLYPNSADAPQEYQLHPNLDGSYSHLVELDDAVFFGYVRVWVNDSQQIITDFSIGGNPGPRRLGPGSIGPRRLGPGSLAPVVSGDGQAIIYGDTVFDDGEFYVMQTATYLEIPDYAHAVGQAYYLNASSDAPDLSGTSISISYLEAEVPRTILEEWLTIYYFDGTEWSALDTDVDETMNYASARAQGPGLYVLAYGEGSYETFLPLTIYK